MKQYHLTFGSISYRLWNMDVLGNWLAPLTVDQIPRGLGGSNPSTSTVLDKSM